MKSFHRRTSRELAEPVSKAGAASSIAHRADQALVEQGLAPSRTAAQRLIAAGKVSWHSRQGYVAVNKAAESLPPNAQLRVENDAQDRFVSRGGIKLQGALAVCGLNVEGMTCLDVGQSTGGFTDCLLQCGAARVVGVEVGHGQLHPRLHDDTRIALHEGINARHLSPADLGPHYPSQGFDLIVCDASFISLSLLLPRWPALLRDAGYALALVKPQFEVGPAGVGKGGIVRDATLYEGVRHTVTNACADNGLKVTSYFESPITGSDGNREFFVFARKPESTD